MIRTNFSRPDSSLVSAFAVFSTATICEAAGRRGAMTPAIKPIGKDMKLCGPALTVVCPVGDNLTLHKAVTVAHPGDVLVADAGGYLGAALWGDILSKAALERRVAGLVLDGATRDTESTERLGFPVFVRGISIKSQDKALFGRIGYPINCGEVWVCPGDIIVGDRDGVVVVRQEEAVEVLAKARDREAREERIMQQLSQGQPTVQLLHLEERLAQLGVIEE